MGAFELNEWNPERQTSHNFADPSPVSFVAQVGSSFSHIRVRVGAAVAKAAAARFMPDSAEDGLLVPFFFGTSQQHLSFHHLQSPFVPQTVLVCRMCSCIYASVLCGNFCSVCVRVHLCSLVYSEPLQLYGFVSFYTALCDTIFNGHVLCFLLIYSSSPNTGL